MMHEIMLAVDTKNQALKYIPQKTGCETTAAQLILAGKAVTNDTNVIGIATSILTIME